jgi:1,4-dihydroxy-2-naphthoate octaprenyltransferase
MSSERSDRTFRFRASIWIRALRAPFLTASAIPVVVGTTAALWSTGDFYLGRFVAALLGVVSLHLGANIANDYFDHLTGCDQLNPEPTPYSGGSRMIERGLVSARATLAASLAFFGIGTGLGLWLVSVVGGNAVLWLGAAGLAGGLLYSAVPVKLSYRGLGEAAVFVLFGPLAVAGAYLCQTGRIDLFPVLASLPCGLLVLAILLVNEVLDWRWDGLAGKRTVVVRLGERRGYLLFLLVYFSAYAWLLEGIVLGIYAWPAAIGLAPAAIAARQLAPGRALASRAATINASRVTVLSHTLTGAVIAASYLVWPLISR